MEMFEINQKVMHCREGLSLIVDKKIINGNEYFLMKCKNDLGETIYVPCESADKIIRHISTIDEANNLIEEAKNISNEYNSNTKQRRDLFKKKLSTGLLRDYLYLLVQYELYKLDAIKNKLGPLDNEMLRYATNYICDEWSITYNIEKDNILDFIKNKIFERKN